MKKALRLTVPAVLVVLAAYAALVMFPCPMFAYQDRYENIAVFSDRPISPAIRAVLGDVQRRLRKSPFAEPPLEHRVFICNNSRLFEFFANVSYRAGGMNYGLLNRNIFMRRSNIERNRLVGRSGKEASGERTLAYFIAHEITHSLEANYLGRYAYWRLPVWKREGYADYVARGADFHFAEQLAAFKRNAREMDFERSGLYLRYQLLVAHLLDNRRITPEVLLRKPFSEDSLERELRGMK